MTTAVSDGDGRVDVPVGDRYGQLLYTSYDDGSGSGGGWQVKDRSGHLTDSETEVLTSRIATRFDVEPPLPQYPTPAEIEARPARLSYATIAPGVGAYWHTVDAGTDGSGRPGNVFAHVVLAEDASARAAMRPIELWGSSDWLRPYGPQEVRSARLTGEDPPRPGGVVTVHTTIQFLLDPAVYRLGLLQVLLDAVYDAMAGGRSVVLRTDCADSPRWIGAVSFFMSPGTARGFAWSTHDKPDLAAVDARRGVHLICAPRDSVVPASVDWVVLDADDDPLLGALGVVAHGSDDPMFAVPVSPWSLLAQAALVDAETATEVIAHQDAVAREVGDEGLSPVWPLAVAARIVQLGDVGVESTQAIVDDHPFRLENSARLKRLVDDAYATGAPDDSEEALKRLNRIRFAGGAAVRAAERLLTCVLRETGSAPGLRLRLDDVPRLHAVDIRTIEDVVASWMSGVRSSLSTGPAVPSDVLVNDVLRVGELLFRLGRPGSELDGVTEALGGLIEGRGVDFLADRARAQALVDSSRDISDETRDSVLLPVVSRAVRHPDDLDIVAWEWILGDHSAIDVDGVADEVDSDALSRRLLPLYVTALLEGAGGVDIEPARRSELAFAGIRVLMETRGSSDGGNVAEIARLSRHATVTVDHLDQLIARFGDAVPPSLALVHVLCSPPSPALDRVVEFVCHRIVSADEPDGGDALAVAGARLRAASGWVDFDGSWITKLLEAEVPYLLAELDPEMYERLDEGLCVLLGSLIVAAHSHSRTWATGDALPPAALERRLVPLQARLLRWLEVLVERDVIDIAWVAADSMRTRMGAEFTSTTPLALPAVAAGDSWTNKIIAARLEANDYRGPTTPEGLRDALWPSVVELPASTAERFFLEYRSVAKEWLREWGLAGRENPRSRFSLTHREDNN